ncbi:MAG: PQQ-dependent sugar dehydrogenase [Planctomycetaceae bacterium]|nr:PQQ-dependent sugar dehydrogenase [Planctomycetaceae bacterium]
MRLSFFGKFLGSACLGVVLGMGSGAQAADTAQERSFPAVPTAMPFTAYVLTDGLRMPWEMLWGPDNMLWVTERQGNAITRVDPRTGDRRIAGTIPEAYPGPQHEGILGMAFAPGFLTSSTENLLYVYYTMKEGDSRWGRLVSMPYDHTRMQLGAQRILLDRLPAGDDHNGGRVRVGPDGKIYLTIGEQGHNQGGNYCLPIEAQRIPNYMDIPNKNWDAYRGKSLRINPDGSIPDDNPEIRGIRSHVFTYGHRNPQGLTFVGEDLYSCEQGPSTDDEINKLVSGGNYGWPHVAGFRDGNAYVYANYSAAPNCHDLPYDANTIPEGVPVQHELEWFDPTFVPPVKTFYTVRNDHNFNDSRCGADHAYLCWPTIAPSSIVYYPANGAIREWRNSLLITTLKTGSLFQVRLSGDAKEVQGDYSRYFRSPNRYRAMAFDPTGRYIYIATDVSGGAVDDEGRPANNVRNPGSILVFQYNDDGTYGYNPDQARVTVGANGMARPQEPSGVVAADGNAFPLASPRSAETSVVVQPMPTQPPAVAAAPVQPAETIARPQVSPAPDGVDVTGSAAPDTVREGSVAESDARERKEREQTEQMDKSKALNNAEVERL